MSEIISISNVSKKFKKKTILSSVSLSIKSGEFIGILGGSGSGKSVLLNLMTGFLKPSYGKIITVGKIGFSAQSNSLYHTLSAEKNIKYFSNIYGIKNKREKIAELVSLLDLEKHMKLPVKKLSGGTQKRVDITCALLEDPKILILDEPFAGLDSFLVNQFSTFLKKLQKKGTTIIVSSHLIHQVESLCDRFFFVQDTKVSEIKKAKLKELYSYKK